MAVRKPRGPQAGLDVAAEEIKRLWGDVEVLDAKKELRVFMNEEDLKKATRKDPAQCAFAQACHRCYGSSKVLFFRSVAYVELPNENGTRRVERYIMPPAMRALVESFDRGEPVIPEAGFSLKPPNPHQSLGSKQRRGQQERLRKRRRLEGERVDQSGDSGQGQGRYRDRPIPVDLLVRSGSGAVHFTKQTQQTQETKKKKR